MTVMHKIATKPIGTPSEVPTLHRVGVWAVHQTVLDATENGVTREVPGFSVTHTPSGNAAWWGRHFDEAVTITNQLAAAYPTWASDAPWADPKNAFWSTVSPTKSEVGAFVRRKSEDITLARLAVLVDECAS